MEKTVMKGTGMVSLLVFILCCLVPALSVRAEMTAVVDGVTWRYDYLSGNTVEITGFERIDPPENGNLVIPGDLNGNSVVRIGEWCLNGVFTSVDIPSSVAEIGEGAFADCMDLETVTGGDGVTAIRRYAFRSCPKLKTLPSLSALETVEDLAFFDTGMEVFVIPATVTSFSGMAFGAWRESEVECAVRLTVAPGNSRYVSDAEGFVWGQNAGVKTSLVFAPCDVSGTLALPEGLARIEAGACLGRRRLSSVSIPASVTEIGESAFEESSVSTVTGAAGVTRCGDGAFWGTPLVENSGDVFVKVGTVLVACRGDYFDESNPVATVTVPSGVTVLADGVFEGLAANKVVIPASVAYIGKRAFEDAVVKTVLFQGCSTSFHLQAFEDGTGVMTDFGLSSDWVLNGWSLSDGDYYPAAEWMEMLSNVYENDVDVTVVPDAAEKPYDILPGQTLKMGWHGLAGYKVVKGLPSGWAWDARKSLLTVKATKPGTFTITLQKGSVKQTISVAVGPKPTVSVDYSPTAVSISGIGGYAVGATVKLTAKPKAGYAFNGWYCDGRKVSSSTTYSFKMPVGGRNLEVRHVWAPDDSISVSCGEEWGEPLSNNFGDYFVLPLKRKVTPLALIVDSESPVKSASAAGLPPGLAFNAKTRKVEGVPTKAGTYYMVFTVVNANGYAASCLVQVLVGGGSTTWRDGSLKNTITPFLERSELYDELGWSADSGWDLTSLLTGVDCGQILRIPAYGTVKAKDLPPGLSLKLVKGEEEDGDGMSSYVVCGRPTKAGFYRVTFTLARGGKSYTAVAPVYVDELSSTFVQVTSDMPALGAATGTGVYRQGSTFKAVAAAKRNMVFAGWYTQSAEDGESADGDRFLTGGMDYRTAVCSVKMTEDFSVEHLYARFVSKSADVANGVSIAGFADGGESTTWRVESEGGGYSSYYFSVSSYSQPMVTVSGLPKAFAVTTKPAKNSSLPEDQYWRIYVKDKSKLVPGKYKATIKAVNVSKASATKVVTIVVPNLTGAEEYLDVDSSDEGYSMYLTTAPTLASLGIELPEEGSLTVGSLPAGLTWNAKTKKITGRCTKTGTYTVRFTVKVGGRNYVSTAFFTVKGLPKWATGTFVGATETIHSPSGWMEEGTISVTVSAAGKVSGSYLVQGDKTSFTGSALFAPDGDDDSSGTLSATCKGKVDGKQKTFKLAITPMEYGDDQIGQGTFTGSISGKEKIEAVWMRQNPWKRSDLRKKLPVVLAGATKTYSHDSNFDGRGDLPVKLTFGAAGTVKATISKTGQSASCVYMPTDDGSGVRVLLGMAPKGKYRGVYTLLSFSADDLDEDGMFSASELSLYEWRDYMWQYNENHPELAQDDWDGDDYE